MIKKSTGKDNKGEKLKKKRSVVTEELNASEIRYRRLFESAKDGILILDAETGKIVNVNPFLIDLLGYSKEEFVEKSIWEIGSFQDVFENKERFLELQQKEYVRYEDLPLVTSAGHEIYVEFVSNVYLVKNKKVIQCNIRDIMARKKTEAALEKTAKELAIIKKSADELNKFTENIIDTIREPLLAIDKDLRVIKASRSFYNFFKVTADETIGKLIYELGNHQWDIPKLKELLEEIIPEKNSINNYEVEHNFSTIGRRVMLLNARQVKRAFGKEKVILLAIEDITERKGKEDTLKETNHATDASLNALLNLMQAPVIIWNPSMVIKRINHNFEQLSGYDAAEVVDKKIDFLFPKEKLAKTLDLLKKHLADGEEIIELDLLTKDKSIRTVLWNSSLILDEEGKEIVATISQDITSRKLKEDKLISLETSYRRLFESAKDGILITDAETGKVIDVNPFLTELLGHLKEEFIEKTIWEIHSFKNFYENKEKFLELHQKESVRYDDLSLVTSDGREILVEFVSNVYQVNNKKLIHCNIRDITERTHTRNEIKFQANLINNVGQAVIATDMQFKVIYWNQAAEKIYGWSVAEAIGASIVDLLQPSEEQVANNIKTLSAGKTWVGESEIKRKDGSSFPAFGTNTPMLDSNGELIGYIGISSDITERKLTEEKLINERNKATQYFETAGIMMVVLDKAGKVTRINKKGCEVLQYPEQEITGKEWFTFLPENNVQAIRTTFKQLMEEEIEDLEFYENTIVNRKGEERLIEWHNVILRDNDGVPVGTLSSGEDITQRKLREKITLAQRDLGLLLNTITNYHECYRAGFKTLSEISGMDCGMIYLFDKDDNSLDAVYSEGFSDKFVEAASHYDAASPNVKWLKAGDSVYIQHKEFPANLSEYIKEEHIKSIAIIPMYYEDKVFGSINLASKKTMAIYTVLKNEMESIVSAIANTIMRIRFEDEIRDLNASLEIKVKERTEQLTRAKKEAESANVSKSEFLSRMSHELRTPLNGILGFAQLLVRKETNPESSKRIKQIMHSGKHLLNLINEVLDIARIESGKLTLSMEPVELRGIITETLDIVSPLAKKRGVKLELEDTAANKLFVKSDQQKLKQVLINLINNAIKYDREGGEVKVMITPKGDNVRVSVRDTGIGIAEEEQHKLFEPFKRIGYEISEVEGTGLGLAVSKKLVGAMNGNIGVESELGVGSTFWIELPQTESPMKTGDQIHDSSKTVNRDNTSEGTILYIEDNISNIQLVEDILRTERPNVNLFTDMYGENAVRMAKEYKPALILLDLDLPDIQGIEVLTLLQKEPATKSIPVVILSADAMQKSINQLLKAGAKHYLSKPLDVDEFLEVTDELLNKGGNEND